KKESEQGHARRLCPGGRGQDTSTTYTSQQFSATITRPNQEPRHGEEEAGEAVGLVTLVEVGRPNPGRGHQGPGRGEGWGADRQGAEAEARQAASRQREVQLRDRHH